MAVLLRKLLIGSGVALCAAVVGQNAVAGFGDDLHWQSVIGIAQPNNVVGSGTGAVTGGGAPWSAFDGHVNVDLERGDVNFDVHGLVLAAGNSIGTRGTIAAVKGTLVCDTDGSASGGNSVLVDTQMVELDERGNARFNGSVGALPAVCISEPDVAFLIRVGAGRWIANGTVLR